MPESVYGRLAGDPVDLIANDREQGASPAFGDDAKIREILHSELAGNPRQRWLQVVVRAPIRRAQALQGLAALLDDLAHQLLDPIETAPRGLAGGELVDGDVELHRGAEKALEQGIVELLRDARAFGKARLETAVETRPHLPHAPAVSRSGEPHEGHGAQAEEPSRLVERGKDGEVQRRALFVPDAVVVGGHDVEAIAPGAQIGKQGLTACSGFLPAAAILSLEPITKSDLFRHGEAQGRVIDLEISREPRQEQPGLRLVGLAVGDDTENP